MYSLESISVEVSPNSQQSWHGQQPRALGHSGATKAEVDSKVSKILNQCMFSAELASFPYSVKMTKHVQNYEVCKRDM